ncbi:MAG TPA: DNA polymerase Y family protein, partial [Steroidobacteraceae bacterium]|nr:DNA polymerase Y family protein [Steroidobacteraceae bacterium]
MKARAIEPLMGDLFDALGRAPAPLEPMPRPKPTTRPPAPALPSSVPPSPGPLRSLSRPAAQPPPPQPHPHRSPALWRAVVFPHLSEQSLTLERLGRIAQRFTSLVSLEPPNALLLEVRGSVRLFGSLERLQGEIDGAWRRLALEASSATAPSTLAALWLARGAAQVTLEEQGALAGALAALPLGVTAWDEKVVHTLRSMGVTRLGELLRLPRGGLARRFGRSMVRDLEVALARQGSPRRRFVPLERFRERRDFESEVESVERLLALLTPMIERCALFLRRRQAGVQSLELRLKYRERPPRHIRLGLASITSARARLEDTVLHTLLRLELEAPVRSV